MNSREDIQISKAVLKPCNKEIITKMILDRIADYVGNTAVLGQFLK
jgi:hypothetical protein